MKEKVKVLVMMSLLWIAPLATMYAQADNRTMIYGNVNQGPPDYESVAKLAEFCKFIECNQLSYKSFVHYLPIIFLCR